MTTLSLKLRKDGGFEIISEVENKEHKRLLKRRGNYKIIFKNKEVAVQRILELGYQVEVL